MMDMLNVMLEKEGYEGWIGDTGLPCLLFMDDAVIEDDLEKFQGDLEVKKRFAKFHKLVLNLAKVLNYNVVYSQGPPNEKKEL